MTREQITNIIGGIDERHISGAAQYNPPGFSCTPERIVLMKSHRLRKPLIIAAAVVLVLSLSLTAYAAGWLSPIFHQMQSMFAVPNPDKEELYNSAEQAVISQEQIPETVALPEFDNSRITLSERYYDGENLLLGVNLEEAIPDMVIGYAPEESLLEQINNVAFFYDVKGNDNLDYLLEQGMDREIYNDYLSNRTDYAKEHDFRNLSAIEFDWYLRRNLTSEAYEKAWRKLQETGILCVVDSSVYIGDHIVLDDGTDLGSIGQQNMDSNDADAHSGNIFIEINNLPEAARNKDALNINLKIKNGRTYYYMELGGPAYFLYETAAETLVPFTVENANK